MRTLRTRLAAALLVLPLALSACSNDKTKSPAAAPGGASSAGNPVKVMLIYDETGSGAAPELVDGANAGLAQVNANGGIKGRPIEMTVCKTGNDPNIADNCARQAQSLGVSAVVGELTLQKGHEKILREAKIPIIGAVTSGTDLTEIAQFPLDGSTPIQTASLANALAAQGFKKISMARIQIDGGGAFSGFANQGLTSAGQKILNDVPVPTGAADMAPYVQAVLAGGTDAILTVLPGTDSTAFIKQLKKDAPNIAIGIIGTQKEKVADALGTASDGLYEALGYLPPSYENTATKNYVAAMSKQGISETRGFRLNAYAAVLAFAEAAKKVPDPTNTALWDALPTMSGIDIGLTPPIQWQKGNVGGYPRIFTSCAFIVKYSGGKELPVYDTFRDAYTGQNCTTPPKS
ncbi:ABC transporter substrate-binding protein [Dactylosporangium sp. NPDC050588]|uniref:ABC transporter substrate-binding protein n=1 Tax=Dactylosporangium sp. NPDC050588 TaxID=3157211 RepID=UPI0033D6B8B1